MRKGRVIKSTGSWYTVIDDQGESTDCKLKGKFRVKGIKSTNPVAVGDWVEYDDEGIIHHLTPRDNYIIRKSVNLSRQYHIIAANVDQMILVVTLTSPVTSVGFIDRLLVASESFRIPTIIVFNKTDLISEEEKPRFEELVERYSKIGYQCICTSTVSEQGMTELKEVMKDKYSVIAGHSGVGKSSLVNCLDSSVNLKTGSISEAHFKGKHTTTYAEMLFFEFGGGIIDTPGVKGFGLVDIDKTELAHYFPEMRSLMNECKFNNCVHVNEPKCAVKQAVADGEISMERYDSYLRMYESEEDETYRQ